MRLLVAALTMLLCGALAAPTLSVNGHEVSGLTLTLVEGSSYAPVGSYAEALGARSMIDYGSGLVSLTMGGRTVVLRTFTEPADALADGVTINVNGAERPGPGAVFQDGQLFLPVSAVAQAFLGYTTYVPERERVMVVMRRGEVRDLDWQREREVDRIVATLDANVPYSLYYNEPIGALEVRFERSDPGDISPLEDGRFFDRVDLLNARGNSMLRVALEEDVGYRTYTVPDGRGYRLVIDLFREAVEQEEVTEGPRVVIDAAHGGDDEGMATAGQSESLLTLQFSRQLAELLTRRGIRAELTRNEEHDIPLASRSGMGVGADLFLSLHAHPSSDGAIGVYYLAEADGAASLDLAIRQNAETELQGTTDSLRRRLLLNLIPDVDVGRRYAQGLQGELFSRANVRVEDPRSAPLAVLAGAAGRGLLLELPAEEAGSDELVAALAEAVAALLEGRELSR